MKVKSGFVVRKVADCAYAVAVGERAKEFAGMVKLSGAGEFIWKMLEKDTSEDAVVSELVKCFDVDEERAAKDVRLFTEKLSKAGLLID